MVVSLKWAFSDSCSVDVHEEKIYNNVDNCCDTALFLRFMVKLHFPSSFVKLKKQLYSTVFWLNFSAFVRSLYLHVIILLFQIVL